MIKSGNNVRKILFCHFRVAGKAVEHLFPCQPLQRHFPAGRSRGQQLRTEAFHQSGQQRQPLSQSALTVAVQSRPDVVSGDAHVFCLRQQQGFGKLADEVRIRAGKFVHLVADTQEIVVVAGVFPDRRICRHRQQPCLPQRCLCSRHIQCIPVDKTATGQLLQQFTHRRLPRILPHLSYSCRSEIPVPAGGSFSVPAAPAALYPVQPAAGNSAAGRPALSTPL
ncbi:hypothetical protein BvCms854_04443 [Escherichia coli]|nr:hypothetical protein BvCms854_04443 [Escherichia coli]